MSLTRNGRARASASSAGGSAIHTVEFGLGALLAMAAGGAVGSGWLLGAYQASSVAGSWAWLSWLLGGLLMLVVAWVMVELGRLDPQSGGLVMWPLDTSGPVVATVVAAVLWIFYALNSASEAAAVVQGLGSRALYDYVPGHSGPTGWGEIAATLIMVPIVAVNLLLLSWIRKGMIGLSAFKVFVPVVVMVLLFVSGFDAHTLSAHHVAAGFGTVHAVVSAITVGGVVYAYIGFQGPLDFSGQVKKTTVRRLGVRLDEAARLRIAVLGTVVGSTVLYTLLQVAFLGHNGWHPGDTQSPYTRFAMGMAVTGGLTVFLVRVDSVVSPAGAGAVFALLLEREAEELSRVGLTDRRLADPGPARRADPEDRRRILTVNLVIGMAGLWVMGADWGNMISAISVFALLIYAMPAVSLLALSRHRARREVDAGQGTADLPSVGPRWWIPAWISFVGISEVLYWAGYSVLWRGLAILAVGAGLLFLLPAIDRFFDRRLYDADPVRHGVRGGVVLTLYLGGLLLLGGLGMATPRGGPAVHEPAGSVLAALLGTLALVSLYRCSVAYMRERDAAEARS